MPLPSITSLKIAALLAAFSLAPGLANALSGDQMSTGAVVVLKNYLDTRNLKEDYSVRYLSCESTHERMEKSLTERLAFDRKTHIQVKPKEPLIQAIVDEQNKAIKEIVENYLRACGEKKVVGNSASTQPKKTGTDCKFQSDLVAVLKPGIKKVESKIAISQKSLSSARESIEEVKKKSWQMLSNWFNQKKKAPLPHPEKRKSFEAYTQMRRELSDMFRRGQTFSYVTENLETELAQEKGALAGLNSQLSESNAFIAKCGNQGP